MKSSAGDKNTIIEALKIKDINNINNNNQYIESSEPQIEVDDDIKPNMTNNMRAHRKSRMK